MFLTATYHLGIIILVFLLLLNKFIKHARNHSRS